MLPNILPVTSAAQIHGPIHRAVTNYLSGPRRPLHDSHANYSFDNRRGSTPRVSPSSTPVPCNPLPASVLPNILPITAAQVHAPIRPAVIHHMPVAQRPLRDNRTKYSYNNKRSLIYIKTKP